MAMPDSSADDRRKYVRFTLKAYGLNHVCHIRSDSERTDAKLIDITPAGARLRFSPPGAKAPARGRIVEVELRLPPVAPQGQKVSGEVRWSDELECGLLFKPELDCSVGDLQRILDIGLKRG